MTRIETYPTLAEAARALSGAVYMGGGTIVMRALNAGEAGERIVRTRDPALGEILVAGDQVRLGAGVTMAAILARPELAVLHPVARAVGGPQLRNMATVGGNLFAPPPYGDFTVALIALGARALIAGQGGARPVEELMRERARPPLVAAVEFARPRDPRAFGFLKVTRVRPKGVAVMSLALLAPREGGRLRGVRMAWGNMGPHPLRGAAVERVLEGAAPEPSAFARAAALAAEGLDPPTDALASAWYRREVAGVHLSRLLQGMA